MTTRACAACRPNLRLIDDLTDAVWGSVTEAPGLGRLYGGYRVSIRSVIRDRMCHHGPGAPSPDPEAFAASLARDILTRLEEILRGTAAVSIVGGRVRLRLGELLAAASARRPDTAAAGVER